MHMPFPVKTCIVAVINESRRQAAGIINPMSMKTFLTGAVLYPCLELLYRGRTHISMAPAGGLSLCALRRVSLLPLPRPLRAFFGAALITGIELVTGLCLNRRHRIWDYRNRRGNIGGQICPAFFCIWYGLALLLTARRRK